jgi:hypothetical protein
MGNKNANPLARPCLLAFSKKFTKLYILDDNGDKINTHSLRGTEITNGEIKYPWDYRLIGTNKVVFCLGNKTGNHLYCLHFDTIKLTLLHTIVLYYDIALAVQELDDHTVLINLTGRSKLIDVHSGETLWEIENSSAAWNWNSRAVIAVGTNCIATVSQENQLIHVWDVTTKSIVDTILFKDVSKDSLTCFNYFKDATIFCSSTDACFLVNVETKEVKQFDVAMVQMTYNLGYYFLVYNATQLIVMDTETYSILCTNNNQNIAGMQPSLFSRNCIVGRGTNSIVLYSPHTNTANVLSVNIMPYKIFPTGENKAFIFALWKTAPVTIYYYYGGFVHDLRRPLSTHQRTNKAANYACVFGLRKDQAMRYMLWTIPILQQTLCRCAHFYDIEIN